MDFMNRVEKDLRFLGLQGAIERLDEHVIRINLRTESASRINYRVYFLHHDIDVIFESIVSESASYDPNDPNLNLPKQLFEVELFYQGLLSLNDDLRPLALSLVKLPDDSWKITLGGSQETRFFDIKYLDRVLELFENFYVENFEQLMEAPAELNLKLGGKANERLGKFRKYVLGYDSN
jgi:hypothetical protein